MDISGYDTWKLAYPPEWDREPEDPDDDDACKCCACLAKER